MPFTPGAIRLAMREREITLPVLRDGEGRPVTLVLRPLEPERALALRNRMPGSFYELVQKYEQAKHQPLGQKTEAQLKQEFADVEEAISSAIPLIEMGVVGAVDPETGATVPCRVRFKDEDLDDDTIDGRVLTAGERTSLASVIAQISGEGEVAAAHATFRVRERGRRASGLEHVEAHAGDGGAAAPAAAVADGGPGGAAVAVGARGDVDRLDDAAGA